MDARMWHTQATARPDVPALPRPLRTVDAAGESHEGDRQALRSALSALALPSHRAASLERSLSRTVARNDRRPAGAKSVISVTAPFTAGKSTLVKAWAQAAYRDLIGTDDADARPTWQPSPGVRADWVPHVYITLRSNSKIKDLNASILAYLGYPSEGLLRVTTTRVVRVLKTHGVRLLIIDDIHMLDTRHADQRDVLDYLKFLNTELGELGGTLLVVGANLDRSPIHLDPQIAGRLDRHHLHPYEISTSKGRREWQTFLKAAEELLLPYLPNCRQDTFSREHAGYIWRRTQGFVGDTATLLSGALLNAVDAGADSITRADLDSVSLSARAHAAEADLVAAASARAHDRDRDQVVTA